MKHMHAVLDAGKAAERAPPQNPHALLFPGCLPHLRPSGIAREAPESALHRLHCPTTSEATYQDPAVTRVRTRAMLQGRKAQLEKRREETAASLDSERALRQSLAQAAPLTRVTKPKTMSAKAVLEAHRRA